MVVALKTKDGNKLIECVCGVQLSQLDAMRFVAKLWERMGRPPVRVEVHSAAHNLRSSVAAVH